MPEKPIVSPGHMVGAYRITELIGKGGFSEVWSAWDTHLNRLVAIKLIPRTAADAHNTIQFGREASMVTRLEHPHILPLYDFGETPEFRYLVMRYVTGGSLAQRLEHERLPVQEVLRLMTPIGSTLDYIHQERVVHRDLKPGNILLDAQGLPYLTDFGLAKELTDETRPMHSASGTLTYMPPEQFSGGSMSPSSDMYSFGILLYQLFSGELPYEGKVALGMRQIATQDRMPDITFKNPQLPARLNDYLWQLTDPDSTKRPTSAVEAMKQIAEALQGVSSEGGPAVMPGITLALESGAYRQREAESLLQQNLSHWTKDEFTLSLTHFVLLDILLRDLKDLVTPEVRSLMLRGALEYNQQVDHWWKESGDSERQRACWHAVLNGNDAVCTQALSLAVTMPWVQNASDTILNSVGKRLMPPSEFTPIALEFLERSLQPRAEWAPDERLQETDDNLKALAMSKSPLATRAGALIGTARRMRAVMALPTRIGQANPILTAYETAGSLPVSIPLVERIRLLLMLAARQLTRNPVQARDQYGWAAAGSALSMGLMVYIVFRSTDLLGNTRVLNTLGLGLLFGLWYAIGIWLARHIGQRLQIAPFWLRTILAVLAGGAVVAFGFYMFQRLVYDDVIEVPVAIFSGLLYVFGFALSVGMPPGLQLILGSAGVAAAYLVPWTDYLNGLLAEVDIPLRPPFVFDDSDPTLAIWLVIGAALLLGIVTLGYIWRRMIQREMAKQKTASN